MCYASLLTPESFHAPIGYKSLFRRLEADAAERTRKFSMLQRGFKSSEDGLRQQLEAVTVQIDVHRAQADSARAQAEEDKGGALVRMSAKGRGAKGRAEGLPLEVVTVQKDMLPGRRRRRTTEACW